MSTWGRRTTGWSFLALCGLVSGVLHAATFDADNTQKLIEAIEKANDRPGRDVVRLAAGSTYELDKRFGAGPTALPRITDDLLINGRGSAITWTGPDSVETGIMHVDASASVEIVRLTIGGAVDGAIRVEGGLTLRDSVLRDNRIQQIDAAGALTVHQGGTARVIRSFFDANAGIRPTTGGGIYNAGELTVVGSAFRGNLSTWRCGMAGQIPCRFPGLSRHVDAIFNTGRGRIINSTFRGNPVASTGNLKIINATLVYSDLYQFDQGRLRVANSVIARAGCNEVNSLGHNVATSGACKLDHPTDRLVGATRLGLSLDLVFRDSQLVAPTSPESPLVDTAGPARCPRTDALARPRPVDGDHDGIAGCDIGAFELHPGDFPVDGRVVGLWFEPDRDGHYLLVERPAPGRITVFWATYDGSGNPLWLFGSGTLDGNSLETDLTLQRGMRFGIFDRADLNARNWGELTLEFSDCAHLTMSWRVDGEPDLNGEATLTRLTEVSGKECRS